MHTPECRMSADMPYTSTCLCEFVYVCVCLLVSTAFDYGFLLSIREEAVRVRALNEYLSSRSYLAGFSPSSADAEAFALLAKPPHSEHVHALRWYRHIEALQQQGPQPPPELCSE